MLGSEKVMNFLQVCQVLKRIRIMIRTSYQDQDQDKNQYQDQDQELRSGPELIRIGSGSRP